MSLLLLKKLSQWNHGLQDNLNSHSEGSESSRRTSILRFLLVLVSIVSVSSVLYLLYLMLIAQASTSTSLWFMLCANALIAFLYRISAKGHALAASILLVILVLIAAMYVSLRWGVSAPQGLLLFGLSVSFAGILLRSTLAFSLIVLNSIVLLLIYIIQKIYFPQSAFVWRSESVTLGDVIVYAFTLGVGGIVAGISNKIMEKSLQQRDLYALELENEKNMLDQRVKERTKELEKAKNTIQETHEHFRKVQKQRFIEVNKLAAIGKISTELLHNVSNSITYAAEAFRDETKNGVYLSNNTKSHSKNLKIVEEGKVRTYDMLKLKGGAEVFQHGAVSTQQLTDAVISKL